MLTREILHREFEVNKKSATQIAEEYNTYTNNVLRKLRKFGFKIPDKSEAQSKAIATGRHKHPTKGKTIDNETRLKISESMAASWANLSDAERLHRSEVARKQWEATPQADKDAMKSKAAEAMRKASVTGSKLEKFLLLCLKAHGYNVNFHEEHIIEQEALQIDMLLPDLKVAIEVDGPTHFEPVWGEANLQKHIRRDQIKNGLLLSAGYTVIRIKNSCKHMSKKKQRLALQKVLYVLCSKHDNKIIEIEV